MFYPIPRRRRRKVPCLLFVLLGLAGPCQHWGHGSGSTRTFRWAPQLIDEAPANQQLLALAASVRITCTSHNTNIHCDIYKHNYTILNKHILNQNSQSLFHHFHVLFQNLFHQLAHRPFPFEYLGIIFNMFRHVWSKWMHILISIIIKRDVFAGCGQHKHRLEYFSKTAQLSPHCQHLYTGNAAFGT